MRTREEVREARSLIGVARDFLREKGDHTQMWPSFEFHAGALFALCWVLQEAGEEPFVDHLRMLSSNRRQLTMPGVGK